MITIEFNKANAGHCREDGEGERVYLHWRNQARCISAGFSFVWFV